MYFYTLHSVTLASILFWTDTALAKKKAIEKESRNVFSTCPKVLDIPQVDPMDGRYPYRYRSDYFTAWIIQKQVGEVYVKSSVLEIETVSAHIIASQAVFHMELETLVGTYFCGFIVPRDEKQATSWATVSL